MKDLFRLGKYVPSADPQNSSHRPRPVLIKLTTPWDRRLILLRKSNLRNYAIPRPFVREDVAPEHRLRQRKPKEVTSSTTGSSSIFTPNLRESDPNHLLRLNLRCSLLQLCLQLSAPVITLVLENPHLLHIWSLLVLPLLFTPLVLPLLFAPLILPLLFTPLVLPLLFTPLVLPLLFAPLVLSLLLTLTPLLLPLYRVTLLPNGAASLLLL